jgi:hypothetical protein
LERTGIPVDVPPAGAYPGRLGDPEVALIREVNVRYGVYDGSSFRTKRFGAYLAAYEHLIGQTASGALALDDNTFRDMAKAYPLLQPLRELRHALGELRLERLAVGSDGRNRTMLSAFASRTGRTSRATANSCSARDLGCGA